MVNFKDSDEVEFTGPAWCKVIAPASVKESVRVVRVTQGMTGIINGHKQYKCMPGDVPVLIHDRTLKQNVVLSVREGLIAAVRIECDPRTGDPKYKH